MPDVDDILKSNGLTRETATEYIRAIVAGNQAEAARRSGLSRDTISRYKKAFNEMPDIERAYVIYTLMEEHYADLLHDIAKADAHRRGR